MNDSHPTKKLRILAISDTHCNHHLIDTSSWPEADVFIHAGDFTITSTRQELTDFRNFLRNLPYKHKLVVAGNHDFAMERSQQLYQKVAGWWQVPETELINTQEEIARLKEDCIFLMHEGVEIEGVTFFGTPHVWYGTEMCFTLPFIKKEDIWKKRPENLDVLITHSPPYGIGDKTISKSQAGCRKLLNAVIEIGPKVHIFGHIHQSYGDYAVGKTHFYNVCYMNQHYDPKNQPRIIQIQIPQKKNCFIKGLNNCDSFCQIL